MRTRERLLGSRANRQKTYGQPGHNEKNVQCRDTGCREMCGETRREVLLDKLGGTGGLGIQHHRFETLCQRHRKKDRRGHQVT